jgi:hypothetical protein
MQYWYAAAVNCSLLAYCNVAVASGQGFLSRICCCVVAVFFAFFVSTITTSQITTSALSPSKIHRASKDIVPVAGYTQDRKDQYDTVDYVLCVC